MGSQRESKGGFFSGDNPTNLLDYCNCIIIFERLSALQSHTENGIAGKQVICVVFWMSVCTMDFNVDVFISCHCYMKMMHLFMIYIQ